jgi:hypothetical protein
MKIVFALNGEKKEIDVRHVLIEDSSENRYRISLDVEHGIEILAEDGKAYIEPHTSNEIVVFTQT